MDLGEVKTCGIHDLLRDFCLRELEKEHSIHSPKVQYIRSNANELVCFLCSKSATDKKTNNILGMYLISSHVSPFDCGACKLRYTYVARSRLVRVMDGNYCIKPARPTEVQYIEVEPEYNFSNAKFVPLSGLHLLWNLQTLIIRMLRSSSPIVLPKEIWEMPELRHIVCFSGILSDPVNTHNEEKDFIILKNLQTLREIQNFKCTKDTLNRIPNLETLAIQYNLTSEGSKDSLYNLAQLRKLQHLMITNALEITVFPKSLKSLTLVNCRIHWKDITIIGSLPCLEVLRLWKVGEGTEWNPAEGEFLRLRGLGISDTNLVYWRANSVHFPILEWLELDLLDSLEEIPSGVGDIPTLRSIKLCKCSKSALNSLKQIWEEQSSMGNDSLECRAYGYENEESYPGLQFLREIDYYVD